MNAKRPFAIQLDHINKLCEAALAQPYHVVSHSDRRYQHPTSRQGSFKVERSSAESVMRTRIAG